MFRFFSRTPRVDKAFAIIIALALVVGLVARTYQLSLPSAQVFDEVYFPVFAAKMLQGELAFDAHPTLGKLLIAPGIALFGDNPFGWRVVVCLFGLAFVVLMGYGTWRWSEDRTQALIAAALCALSGILVTYSRVGLIDGLLAFFIFSAFFASLSARRNWHFIALGVLIGLAVSIKWIAIGVIAPIGYVAWRKKYLRAFLLSLTVAAATYLGIETFARILTDRPNLWHDIREWNWQAWNYHRTLTATHPWSSQWWSWPLMLRPVLMYYQTNAQGLREVITNLDNPFLWWSTTAAALLSAIVVVRRAMTPEKRSIALALAVVFALGLIANQVLLNNPQGVLLGLLVIAALAVYVIRGSDSAKLPVGVLDHPVMPMLVGYLAFFVPWMFIGRVVFNYHYLPSFLFALLMLSYWLRQWYVRQRVAVLVFLCFLMALSLFYLPLNMGMPIPEGFEKAHFWIQSWL